MKNVLLTVAVCCCFIISRAQTTVTKSASLFYNSGSGQAWSNPENLMGSDNQRASSSIANLLGSSSATTQLIVAQDFGFAIPQQAIVLAVRVRAERRSTSGEAYDQTIQLVKGGYLSGANKAVPATAWSATDTYSAYGNTTSDLWSNTLTPFDVNSPNFGVAIAATLYNPSFLLGAASADIDHVEISVTYSTTGLTDHDADGVADAIDYDAENDGIPNNREIVKGPVSTFGWTAQADGTQPSFFDINSGGLTINTKKTGTPTLTTFAVNNTFSATSEKEINLVQTGSSAASKTVVTLTLNKAVAFPQFLLQDIDASPGQFIDNVKITASYLGQTYNLSAAEFTTSASNTYLGGNTFIGNSTAADNTTSGQVAFKLNTIVDKIVIEYWNSDAAAGNQGMGIGGMTYTDPNLMDADGDGLANQLDADSDGDGIADLSESGGVDTNGDGRVDGLFADSDNDGLANKYDASSGGAAIANLDTDGDGLSNANDLDSDNDGLPDAVEAGAADTNNDGRADATGDADGDGICNAYDGDANNDGTAENTAGALLITGPDANNDGVPDAFTYKNTDKQGMPDMYDMDADGDGIPDVTELNITDADRNGAADGADANNDGWSDAVDALAGITVLNTDGDAVPDYKDIDSDNDGITDNVEGMSTAAYISSTFADSDGDGLADVYDNDDAVFGGNPNNGIICVNTDGDSQPDYRDTDSDNDGIPDRVEGHDYNLNGAADDNVALSGTDTDGDGLDNTFDASAEPYVNQAGMLNGGAVGTPANNGAVGPLQKTNISQYDRDWRFSTGGTLALRLLSFTASETASGLVINWRTANAEDVSGYQLQKSTNGNSFTTYTERNHITNAVTDTFSVTDSKPTGRVYYRLLIKENSGKSTTSQVISLSQKQQDAVRVYPNPASGWVNVELPSAPVGASGKIIVYSATGQQVKMIDLPVGTTLYTMDISRFAPGAYSVQTVQNNLPAGNTLLLVH